VEGLLLALGQLLEPLLHGVFGHCQRGYRRRACRPGARTVRQYAFEP
jgi:hypothetical protein